MFSKMALQLSSETHMNTPESTKFIERLKITASPKWFNLQQLQAYLDPTLDGFNVPIWCVVNDHLRLVPVDLNVVSFSRIMKEDEVIDLEMVVKTADKSDLFKVRASIFMLKEDAKTGDVTRINYRSFGSFSRVFKYQEDRDLYLDELRILDDMLAELAQAYHNQQIATFIRFFGTGKL